MNCGMTERIIDVVLEGFGVFLLQQQHTQPIWSFIVERETTEGRVPSWWLKNQLKHIATHPWIEIDGDH